LQLLDLPHERLPAPDRFRDAISSRCLDAGTVETIRITQFDDADRDAATVALAHLSRAPERGM